MLKVPPEFAIVGINGNRRAGIKSVAFSAASECHPGFGLGGSPVGQVENGIIAAGDPHLATRAISIRKVAPGFGSLVAAGCNRVKPPELFAALRVVCTKKTFFFLVSPATA